ncbi:DNA polymerase III subunit delta [Inediibacterium massiliense]|uniref:DNA polymerase III subunit delta n=1 Tax=Inediibacterium massiliense TaxID=1658111 RepID=UPI0006B55ABD|nr:DNA polymerase III subunit delta [Inediibacterium massiliense]
MDYKDVLKDLKNKQLKNLYLLYGTEYYLMDHTMDTLKKGIVDPSFEQFNYQMIDGKEANINRIINACETLPFMGNKRMVVVKDLECFTGKRNNISEEEEKNLLEYFKNIPDTTYLFFVSKQDVDQRKKIVKAIKSYGDIIVCSKLLEKDVYKWIQKSFHKYNKEIKDREIVLLVEMIGYLDKNSQKTLEDLDQEIHKLCSYVGDRKTILKDDIEILAPKTIENNIFALVEAIGTKDVEKALYLFNDMIMEGEAETKILYMITRQFRHLFQIKIMENQGYTPMAIAPKLGLKQFVVKKYLNQARNFNIQTLKKSLEVCLSTDEAIKKGRMDGKVGMEMLIVQFATKSKKAY